MDNKISGVINIYKEKDYTSHDVVNIVRKALGRVKTGHTGTLDPQAEGVLPVCVGKATKFADSITMGVKEYRAVLKLGVTTDTQDYTGKVLSEKEVTVGRDEIEKAIKGFIGDIMQTPPMYSALKVGGKKLYEIAREGKSVEREQRPITIHNISQIKFLEDNQVEMLVLCSKGTYIRTLCEDIGNSLGCGGNMSALTRTRSGNFSLEDSIRIEDFKRLVEEGRLENAMLSLERVLDLYGYKRAVAQEQAQKLLLNGNPFSKSFLNIEVDKNQSVAVYASDGELVGIYKEANGIMRPEKMLI